MCDSYVISTAGPLGENLNNLLIEKILGNKVSSMENNTKTSLYLFLLNKNPLFEKSDPELKRGGYYYVFFEF